MISNMKMFTFSPTYLCDTSMDREILKVEILKIDQF